jgi:hypothetical protein
MCVGEIEISLLDCTEIQMPDMPTWSSIAQNWAVGTPTAPKEWRSTTRDLSLSVWGLALAVTKYGTPPPQFQLPKNSAANLPAVDHRRTGRIWDDVAVFLVFGGGYLLAAMVVTWLLRRLPEAPPTDDGRGFTQFSLRTPLVATTFSAVVLTAVMHPVVWFSVGTVYLCWAPLAGRVLGIPSPEARAADRGGDDRAVPTAVLGGGARGVPVFGRGVNVFAQVR